ncbi:MAG TPA: hypothetical protein VG268_04475 [Streptosporangiaceae bacterium]|nr:hypothetical protein [Streptosporangiaceae bacterium]
MNIIQRGLILAAGAGGMFLLSHTAAHAAQSPPGTTSPPAAVATLTAATTSTPHLLSQLGHHGHIGHHGAGLLGHRWNHAHPYTLASHYRFGNWAAAGHGHTSSGGHLCAHQTGGGEPSGSDHRSRQPVSSTAGGLLHLTITI